MKTAIACLLILFGCVSPLLAAITKLVELPDATALSRAESAFELYPGVIVDPVGGGLYLMSPDGGVEKVSMSEGEVVWSTTKAAKPLALYGDLLIGQSERTDAAAAGALDLVLLNSLVGGQHGAVSTVSLPSKIWGVVDEQMGSSFVTRSVVRAGEPFVTWEYKERYVKGVAPEGNEPLDRDGYVKGVAPEVNEPLDQRQGGAYRLDFSTGQAVAVDEVITTAMPSMPVNVDAWGSSNKASIPVVRTGQVLATTQVHGEHGLEQITLKRWDATSGAELPDIELFSGPHILQFTSSDGRHLLVAEHADPGDLLEYKWSIFSLETGKQLGQVSRLRSHAWFFVSGETLVYVEPAYGHRVDNKWVDEPPRVKAILLNSGFALWQRSLRNTTYTGAYPP